MRYNYNFDIATVLFFSLTIIFYIRKKRIKDKADVLFRTMLIFSMTSTVFDFLSAALESVCMAHPFWILYAVNIIFIAAMQACLPVFFLYSCASAGRFYRMSAAVRAATMIPFAVTMTLLLLSPVGRFGVFYIDENHMYQTGATHLALYFNTAVYMIASLLMLFKNIRTVSRAARNVIFIFSVLVFISIVMQLVSPGQLLTASGTALALTAVFYALQSPIDRINPLTGAFSRTMLPSILRELGQKRQSYTMLMISLFSFEEMSRAYGAVFGDAILKELSAKLQARYPEGMVVYMDTCEFVVVVKRLMGEEEAEKTRHTLLGILKKDCGEIPMEISFAALPSGKEHDVNDTLVTMDCIFREKRLTHGDGVFYADAKYRTECKKSMLFESSLESVFKDGRPELILKPYFDRDRRFAGADAQLSIKHPATGGVSHEQLFSAAERAGMVWEYYSMLFGLLEKEKERLGGQSVGIELSAAVCIQKDAAERLKRMVESAGMLPSGIALSIREEELASALPAVYENVGALKDMGFMIVMTDFAVGYTDLSRISERVFTAVRLHESLMLEARDARQLAMLEGVVSIIKNAGIIPICAGVDTPEDIKRAVSAGAELMQGKEMPSAV